MEARPYSVARYRPLVKHNVKLAEKYERLTRLSKGNKSKKYARKAQQYRRRARTIASKWTAQVRWNVANWQYVMERMFGPPDPEAGARILWELKTEEDARKARSYDFWNHTDVHETVATDSQHGTGEVDHTDG
jgi:hypothetical protein